MRSLHEAGEAVETYSPAEEQFNRRRRSVGMIGGPLVLIALLLLPIPIPAAAHRLAAILLMMVILWITEALPLAVTALIGPVLAIILQVAPARTVFAPFADPIIFLFIGSFMLAEAMFAHGLDRRIAFGALSSRAVGGSPTRILVVYGGVATAISMWISNTATTAMMFPIGLSIVAHLTKGRESELASRNFATAMMLMAAFGASIGGMGTPIGTPPNLIGKGMLERIAHEQISFFQWMLLGVPLTVLLFGFLVVYFRWRLLKGLTIDTDSGRPHAGGIAEAGADVEGAAQHPHRLWRHRRALAVPGCTRRSSGLGDSAVARGYEAAVPESVAAMIGAILLFLLPVNWRARRFTLSWEQAVRIDWGIILLFGGGLAMGALAFSTGLAEAMGHGITSWLPVRSSFSLTVLFTAIAIVMSETASNTASANMIVPVAIAVAQAAGDQSARAGAWRDIRRVDGLHDADLHAAKRHRLQLRPRADLDDDAQRHCARHRRLHPHRHRGDGPRLDDLIAVPAILGPRVRSNPCAPFRLHLLFAGPRLWRGACRATFCRTFLALIGRIFRACPSSRSARASCRGAREI